MDLIKFIMDSRVLIDEVCRRSLFLNDGNNILFKRFYLYRHVYFVNRSTFCIVVIFYRVLTDKKNMKYFCYGNYFFFF